MEHWTMLADAADAADEILLEVFGVRAVCKDDKNLMTRRGFEAVLREMTRELLQVVQPAERKALQEALHALDVNWKGMNPTDIDEALERAASALGGVPRVIMPPVVSSLSKMGQHIVTSAKGATRGIYDLPVAGAFDVIDEKVIKHAAQSHALYVRDEYGKRAVAASARAREVISAGLREGLDRRDLGKRLAVEMTALSANRSQNYWTMVSSVFAGRARAWGELSSFAEAGLEEYEISSVLDAVTCSACRLMHGRVFSTGAAMARFAAVADSGDPEAVRNLQPFLGVAHHEGHEAVYFKRAGERVPVARVLESAVGRDNAQGRFGQVMGHHGMEQAGITSPPFHPHCRCMLVPTAKALSTPVAQVAPLQPLVSLLEDPNAVVEFGKVPLHDGEPLNGVVLGAVPAPNFASLPSVDIGEPPLPAGATMSTGCVVVEPDGRIWVVEPSGHYGGYEHTYPKGKLEKHLTPQQNALKELYEEAGLVGEITGHIGDFKGTTGTTRYYVAKRTGGAPWTSHWESEKVKLVPLDKAVDFLNADRDKKVLAELKTKLAADPELLASKPLVKPPAKAKKPKAPVTSPQPELAADVVLHRKDGGAKGSNQGGFYTGSDGVRRYVKFYDDPAQPSGEHLANSLYRDLGHTAPNSHLFEYQGRLAYASDLFVGGQTLADLGGASSLKKAEAKQILKGFVADVLTANWDAVGTGWDNIMRLPDGRWARIDNGGSFLMRAQSGRKPDAALNAITEWDVFFTGNAYYRDVAKAAGVSGAADMRTVVSAEIRKLLKLRDAAGGWEKYVDERVPRCPAADRARIVEMLDARTKLLEAKLADLKPARAPKTPAARFVARQYSNVLPRTGLNLDQLPETRVIDDFYEKISRDNPYQTTSGEKYAEYRERVRRAVAKIGAASKGAIEAFTGTEYGAIRDAEERGKPDARSDAIQRAFGVATPEPGTVFRGISSLPRAVIDKYLSNPEFQLGKAGGATTSTSWHIDVSIDSFMDGREDHYAKDSYKLLYVINGKSQIPVSRISGTSEYEHELLFKRDARFRVTGLSRAAGTQRVLIVEAEEIVDIDGIGGYKAYGMNRKPKP